MKNKFFKILVTVFVLMLLLSQSVFAVPAVTEVIQNPHYTQVIIKPSTPTEDIVLYASFKNPPAKEGRGNPEYIYTGEKVMPEVIAKKYDGSIASPSEYIVTYDEDCDKCGWHRVSVEYLKNGYKNTLVYEVVPGETTRVDMTAKGGKVTLSWSAVKGANAYRVYKKNSSGQMTEVWLPNGEIAAEGLSRTFTDLEAGKTYEMGIMALDQIHAMPTNQLKTFKFTVPKSGEGTLNLVPGINPTTSPKTTKPTTAKTTTQTTTELTTTTTTTETTTESTTLAESTTESTKPVTTTGNTNPDKTDSDNNPSKTVLIFVGSAVVVIIAVIAIAVILKKKK